jgi:hypothetical protein
MLIAKRIQKVDLGRKERRRIGDRQWENRPLGAPIARRHI